MEYKHTRERDELVTQKILRCDDCGDLRVYSYMNNCKIWDDVTLNSRGVIYNRRTGEKTAHAFSKFFNMNQTEETQEQNLPWHSGFRIFKKYDGWLGILYRLNGQHKIATRGSFKSIGALWATEYLKKYDLTKLPDDVTLLFEIICPITKIVVDYNNLEDLILLAAYNRHTGEEYSWDQIRKWAKQFGFKLVPSYEEMWLEHCMVQIKNIPGNELEGFVIRFDNGLRVKIKSEDYFRRSHLLSNLTPLVIWNNMVDGKVPRMVWNEVDQEYHEQLSKIANSLESKYSEIRYEINQQFLSIVDNNNRAEFAKRAINKNHTTALFAHLDKSYNRVDKYIMQQIRPHNNLIE